MTVDKETLIKHRFWIALGAFALLWLIGLILIPTLQGSANETKLKDFADAKKSVSAIPAEPKTDLYRKPLETKEGELKERKLDIWGKAFYQYQANMSTWPKGGNAHLETLDDQPFGSPISFDHLTEYDQLYRQYLASLKLPELAAPVEFLGGWEKVIQPSKGWTVDKPPSVEECWLSQEDLWVKRELLEIVKEALDNVRKFKNVKDVKDRTDLPEGAKRQVLRNGNWELDLITAPDPKTKDYVISEKSTIKNINSWKRNLSLADVQFRVKQGSPDNFMDFAVPVDRVNWDESTDIKKAFVFDQRTLTIDPAKDLEVEQVLTWSTSPIKRIDSLELGYNSHRNANRTCKAKPIGPQKPAEDAAKAPAADVGRGGPMGPGNPGAPVGGPGMKGFGPGGSASDSKSAIKRERYLDFTDQVRWMPLGMVLIVDQAYMQDVETAVVNSRLRIQPTQLAYHRAYGILPSVALNKKDTDKGDKPERSDRPSGTYGQPQPRGPGVGGMMGKRSMFPVGYGPGNPSGPVIPPHLGPGVPSRDPVGDTTAPPEEDPNLVELTIYGIASLYERPPAPTATPAAK